MYDAIRAIEEVKQLNHQAVIMEDGENSEQQSSQPTRLPSLSLSQPQIPESSSAATQQQQQQSPQPPQPQPSGPIKPSKLKLTIPAHLKEEKAQKDAQAKYLRRGGRTRQSAGFSGGSKDDSDRYKPPKFKSNLKLKVKQLGEAPTGPAAFLNSYDRELDSDDEDLHIEEQFVLRMPENDADTDRLRDMVQKRDVQDDVWFKFKDSRRAQFHIGEKLRSAKLVDLPTIIESQKTLDNKQMFKIADICQMLVVGDEIQPDAPETKAFNTNEYVYPHGITPPMKHARKRRFRKRVNRQTIETVEEEVERLLTQDAKSDKVEYDVLDRTAFEAEIAQDESEAGTPYPYPEESFNATPRAESEVGSLMGDREEEEEEEEGGDLDMDLAAEIDKEMENQGKDEDEDDDDDEDDSSSEEEIEEEEEEEQEGNVDNVTMELARRGKLLNEEIRDVETALSKKRAETATTGNPIIKRRFEDALRKLQADLDAKKQQLDDIHEERRRIIEEKKAEEESEVIRANEVVEESEPQPEQTQVAPLPEPEPEPEPAGQEQVTMEVDKALFEV
ncbi:hypothetical protein E3P96_01133 [Wallemia ichthyophaga]|nr:hypothetical protein E3P96_01133 [Wallemia ichthyophaga]